MVLRHFIPVCLAQRDDNTREVNHRTDRMEYQQRALQQGHVAVNSILRDWIKGQVTAVECGILSFEAVFMPHMLTNDGRPLLERVEELLPKANTPKVVQIPHKPDAA
jgi:hypothetical protein